MEEFEIIGEKMATSSTSTRRANSFAQGMVKNVLRFVVIIVVYTVFNLAVAYIPGFKGLTIIQWILYLQDEFIWVIEHKLFSF